MRGRPPSAGAADSAARPGRRAVPEGHVVLGEFGRAHGLRGEIRLKSFTADPLAIASYGALATDRGDAVTLGRVRQAAGDQPDLLVATVAGVASREDAEALNRVQVSVPRERLGESGDEDEFFLADLVGLVVRDEAGEPLGRIAAVPNYGGGDLLEVAPEGGGPTYLLPFTRAVVPAVDVRGGFVTVASPEVERGRDDE